VNNEDREASSEEFGARQRMISILRHTADPYETHDAIETYRSAILHTAAVRMETREKGQPNDTEYEQGRTDGISEYITWLRRNAHKRSYRP
jgi:hypothetical protein